VDGSAGKDPRLVVAGKVKRAGLLATQGIRGGANRRVLVRIKDGGDVFLSYSGFLEDILLGAIGGDPALDCVEGLLRCAGLHAPTSKHRLQAFLCTREGAPFGVSTALDRGDLPAASSSYADLEQLIVGVANA